MKPAVSYSAASRGNITYHDIIALNQKLSVKGSRDFKSLRDFSGGNLDLEVGGGGKEMGRTCITHQKTQEVVISRHAIHLRQG